MTVPHELLVFLAGCIFATGLATMRAHYRAKRQTKQLKRLISHVEHVLSGERDLDFEHMSEGDLSVLASDIDKMVCRLNSANDQLDRQNRRLADALADISHQIKTPLTTLNIVTDLLRRQLVSQEHDEAVLKRVGLITQLHAHIDDLVATLLKLARFDAGVIELEHRPVHLDDLIRTIENEHAIAFDISNITFNCTVEGAPIFSGDAAWTLEALSNIVKNCREHTPEHGTVSIRAYEDTLACRIIVSDSGSGITDHDLPHIFDRFYRGSEPEHATGVNPQGNGIGLSLAQALIRAQGGTIEAKNRKSANGDVLGAQFTVSLFRNTI